MRSSRASMFLRLSLAALAAFTVLTAAKAAHATNFASGTYSAGAQRFTRKTAS